MKLSDASEIIKKPSDASGKIVKPSDASKIFVIEVQWNQYDPNDRNIRNGAFWWDSGQSGLLENKNSIIAMIEAVKQLNCIEKDILYVM